MSLPAEFLPSVEPPEEGSPESLGFAFSDARLLVHLEDQTARVPSLRELESAGLEAVRRQHLGTYGDRGVVSLELPEDAEAPAGMAFKGLRGLFFRMISIARALIETWISARRTCLKARATKEGKKPAKAG